MRTYTQISSGSYQPSAVSDLIDTLAQLDIKTTNSPIYDDYESLWQVYSGELQFYKSIGKSSFHIIYNNAPLRNPSILHALYAIYKKRPVIMIGRPKFSIDSDPELIEMFKKHSPRFQSNNLIELEFAELSFVLNKLRSDVNYKLTPKQEILIINKIRDYLYDMVGQGIGETTAPLK